MVAAVHVSCEARWQGVLHPGVRCRTVYTDIIAGNVKRVILMISVESELKGTLTRSLAAIITSALMMQ